MTHQGKLFIISFFEQKQMLLFIMASKEKECDEEKNIFEKCTQLITP